MGLVCTNDMKYASFGVRVLEAVAWMVLLMGLSACGGGGTTAMDGVTGSTPSTNCSTQDQRSWLSDQFRIQYLYNDMTAPADPGINRSVEQYFSASLFRGNESIPADRYSGFQSTEAFNRFYGDGKTLAYGLAVAGQEVQGRPDLPLWVRDVTPGSPADAAGLKRGDAVLRINDLSAEEAIARFDFAALTPQMEGQELQLVVERAGVRRSLRIAASIHDVMPVRFGRVHTLPNGRKMGIVRFNSMINGAEPEISRFFEQFRQEGVADIVFDLRYNGGGAVDVGARIASMAAGAKTNGQVYAVLRNNTGLQSLNQTFRFNNTVEWQGVARVYVLAGQRTCSASEQMIAGWRGVGIEVVVIGSTTCGKPVGFRPTSYCGTTYSMVNFDSVNARGEGAYYSGLPAQCRVSEDFTKALEDPGEPLTAAALRHAQGLGCPAVSGQDQSALSSRGLRIRGVIDGPEPSGMMVLR
ncbi:MAG: peptidase S41 [Betaproteobacteria bacterium]|jgi:carboxyl-terminal processing protease|nr:peptidase S41 [Betaproteobacteria bacterium]